MGESKTSDLIQNKIKMPNSGQEPPASSKAHSQDLKDMDCLCTLKIKIESQNWDHRFIKYQSPYAYQHQDNEPKSRTSSILQSPKSGLKGHGCSYIFKNNIGPKFGPWVYQRLVTISKSRSKCQNHSQNPLASSKTPNQDLKKNDLCTFKIKLESQILNHWCTKDQ